MKNKNLYERINVFNNVFKCDDGLKVTYTPTVDYMHWIYGTKNNDEIRNIYTNKKKGVTVVIFNDNTKYEFRLSKGDKYDIDKVILMALVRKQNGLQNNSQYNKFMQELRNKVETND